MVERRERRRRDGTVYTVWRARWRDEQGVERSKSFDLAADARAWEAKVRVMKRSGALPSSTPAPNRSKALSTSLSTGRP